MALIYDDVFAILRDLYNGIPFLGWFLMFLSESSASKACTCARMENIQRPVHLPPPSR